MQRLLAVQYRQTKGGETHGEDLFVGLSFCGAGALRPEGWLKKQLEIQAEGLSGHLDQVWPDIRDSAWIGGKAEGWERVPYWLDGFIPLAYLLQKEELIARAKKYVDAILAAQQEDGWICPCQKEERPAYDVWAMFIICKALMVYGQCSGDERARRGRLPRHEKSGSASDPLYPVQLGAEPLV